MKRKMRIDLALILLLTALLAFGAAAAEGAPEGAFPLSRNGALSIQRRCEVASADTGVYREGTCSTLWGTLPAGTVLPVERLSTGFVTVTVNGATGYINATATRALERGDLLYATQPTRVYKRPNTACRYITVPRGTTVTFVAMSGKIVQVERNGVTGYMTIDHLNALPQNLQA